MISLDGRIMTHATVKDTLISQQMDENDNIFTPYHSEAGRHVSFLTDFEDEVMGPEQSFLEHDSDKDFVDVHLGFGTYDSQKCFTLEYDQITNTDVVDSTVSIGEETKLEVSEGMLQGTEELRLSSKGTTHPLTPKSSSDNVDQHVTRKRQHKPPRRYIHESLEPKSNIKRSRCEISRNAASKRKLIRVKPKKQLCHRKMIEGSAAPKQDEPFDGACIQVPFGLPLEEEQVKEKSTSSTWSIVPCHDSDNSPSNQSTISNERYDSSECLSTKLLEDDEFIDESEMMVHNNNDLQTGHRRRKHHVLWTQSEVMKLIEGVSQFGVGRWSKIKTLLFSSSKHRTSVDLKDKWRNLVKASSCIEVKKKGKVRKQLSYQAPAPVLLRVRELAKMYSV